MDIVTERNSLKFFVIVPPLPHLLQENRKITNLKYFLRRPTLDLNRMRGTYATFVAEYYQKVRSKKIDVTVTRIGYNELPYIPCTGPTQHNTTTLLQ